MKNTSFITVTGADERTDLAALAKLDCEVGLLFSGRRGGLGRNRYPSFEWMLEAVKVLPRVAIHVCGTPARQGVAHDDVLLPLLPHVQRIQINGLVHPIYCNELCDQFPNHEVITQLKDGNLALLGNKRKNHSVLIDASGGKGISPDSWVKVETDKAVGFAGGLEPDNLDAELERIVKVAAAGWWVDMESKLRVDDWFSVELASECVEIFHAAIPF